MGNQYASPLPSRDLSKLVCVPSPIAVAVFFHTIKESLLQVEEPIVQVPAGPLGVMLIPSILLANNTSRQIHTFTHVHEYTQI